jgi:hypothetical protein
MVPGTQIGRPDFTNLSEIMAAIQIERARQAIRWSEAHDYHHTPDEWVVLILRYALRGAQEGVEWRGLQEGFIQAAALCVAAVQALELRGYGGNVAAALTNRDITRAMAARLDRGKPPFVAGGAYSMPPASFFSGSDWVFRAFDYQRERGFLLPEPAAAEEGEEGEEGAAAL